MQKNNSLCCIALVCIISSLCGCSVVTIPNPGEVLKTPLGTESIKIGMTKERVLSIWGKPSSTQLVENKEKWGGERELWIYDAQYSSIPVNAGYLSKTRRLYFDGNNLTDME